MASRGEFDGDDSGRESSRSHEESEEQVRYSNDEPKGKMSDYEKQRFSRIAENKARLKALGISTSENALVGLRERKGKLNSCEEDDDYRPGEADGDDEDEEFPISVCREGKPKNKKRKVVVSKKKLNRSDPLGEDDLKKAIALSLQDSGTSPSWKRRHDQEAASWKKEKPELMSKMQMTEDELVIYFFQFDEAGQGFITRRDVAKMATVHDFTWTEEELQDMIRCFDIDKDGKLSLDEFRKIVTRCRMLKQSC